jgi:uncharacterized protein YgiM (DUF1202 family)
MMIELSLCHILGMHPSQEAMRDALGLSAFDKLATAGAFASQAQSFMDTAAAHGFESLFDQQFQSEFFGNDIDYANETAKNLINSSLEYLDEESEYYKKISKYILGRIIQYIWYVFVFISLYMATEFLNDIDAYTLLKNKSLELIGKSDIIKEAKILSGSIQHELLQNKRFVIADSLHVREKPRSASKSIYILKIGYIVDIVEKERNWIKIRFSDSDENVIEGWCYTPPDYPQLNPPPRKLPARPRCRRRSA